MDAASLQAHRHTGTHEVRYGYILYMCLLPQDWAVTVAAGDLPKISHITKRMCYGYYNGRGENAAASQDVSGHRIIPLATTAPHAGRLKSP